LRKVNPVRSLFFFLIIVAVSTASTAQTSAPISAYFDKDWKTVKDPTMAAYYRTIEQNANGFVVRDYFISGKLLMAAECSDVSWNLIKEGKTILYYENGNVKEEGSFHEGRETGLKKSYYENGKPKMETSYDGDDVRYLHYWNEDGEDELADGEGVISDFRSEEYVNYKSILDFKMTETFNIHQTTRDTVYFVVERQPEYQGGYNKMMTDLRQNMHYPKSARRRGISGTVYVSFIIGKDGAISNTKVTRGIDPECDDVAVNAVAKLGKWNPGMHRRDVPGAIAKPVSVRFVLPVKFSLQ
jgi:TonB family protein